jgi:hypothetical protein
MQGINAQGKADDEVERRQDLGAAAFLWLMFGDFVLHESLMSRRRLVNAMYRVLNQMYEWGDCLMWSLAILSVPFWLYVAVYAAPQAQIIAQQQKQDAIWRESRVFCEQYGMPAETRKHTQCVKDLMKIRDQENQRTASELDSIF